MIYDFTKMIQTHVSVDLFLIQDLSFKNNTIKRNKIDNNYSQLSKRFLCIKAG